MSVEQNANDTKRAAIAAEIASVDRSITAKIQKAYEVGWERYRRPISQLREKRAALQQKLENLSAESTGQ